MKILHWQFLLGAMLILLVSCQREVDYTINSTVNPNKIAPLSGEIEVQTIGTYDMTITVFGDIPVVKQITGLEDTSTVAFGGLYADTDNQVEVIMDFGRYVSYDTLNFKTESLNSAFPTIVIDTLVESKMQEGFHLCDMHLGQGSSFFTYPTVFDNNGDIRWTMDLSFFESVLWCIQQRKNGNMLVGSKNKLFEYDMAGNLVNEEELDRNYWIHHEIVEIFEDQYLLGIGKGDARIILEGDTIISSQDYIVLYDGKEDRILKEWDLAEILDVSRQDLNHNLFGKGNWIHHNGHDFNPEDSSLYISGKHQGLAKISWDNELEWIIAPNKNWGKAGRKNDGYETAPYVLKAIDQDGNPYPEDVQNGDVSAEDFDFPWGNHAPIVLENGNIMAFDNGTFRHWVREPSYSRAVEYAVDEGNKTVSQVWQFGKERGGAFFSLVVSDVDVLENDNVLITSGYITHNKTHAAKIVEVVKSSNEVVFEATFDFKDVNGTGYFGWGDIDILYRSERFEF